MSKEAAVLKRAGTKETESVLLTENGEKYAYRKLLLTASFVFFAVLAAGVWLYFSPGFPHENLSRYQSTHRMGFTLLVLIFPAYRLPERMNRYAAVYDTHLHCHSFRFADRQRDAKSLNLTWREIYRLEYQKKAGVLEYLLIYENSLRKPVKLSFALARHRELFAQVCRRVEAANPTAAVSPALKALSDEQREKRYG